MKFDITCTSFWVDDERKKKYEKYGLKFVKTEPQYQCNGMWERTHPDAQIEISSLEELINITNDVGTIVFNGKVIEIYDDYRE